VTHDSALSTAVLHDGMGLTQFVSERLARREAEAEPDVTTVDATGHSTLELAREMAANRQTVTLRDGRRLGYSECGDPDGTPLLAFPGFPSARVSGALLDELGRERGLRVVCPERPGQGVSDPHPDRTLADWPADVRDLCDALGIDRVVVVGISAGGPYALATAALLADRVDRVAVVCGVGPMASVGVGDRLLFYACRFVPPLGRLAMWGVSWLVRSDRFPQGMAKQSEGPEAAVWRSEVGAVVHLSAREAVRQGTTPLVQEAALLGTPWPFALDAIEVPVGLWYARDDDVVPLAMGLHLARAIPTAEVHVHTGQEHLSAYTENVEAVVEFLTRATLRTRR
jgi:pimeloyl-ACP methyl ester carboxylesterase